MGVSCGLLLWMSLRKANKLAFGLIQEKVLSVVVSTAPRVDGDKVAQLTSANQDLSPLYNEVRNKLREVQDANGEGAQPISFMYLIRPLENGDWEYIVDAEEKGKDRSALGDIVEFENELENRLWGRLASTKSTHAIPSAPGFLHSPPSRIQREIPSPSSEPISSPIGSKCF